MDESQNIITGERADSFSKRQNWSVMRKNANDDLHWLVGGKTKKSEKIISSGFVSGSRDWLERGIQKPRVTNLGHRDLCICQNSLKIQIWKFNLNFKFNFSLKFFKIFKICALYFEQVLPQ